MKFVFINLIFLFICSCTVIDIVEIASIEIKEDLKEKSEEESEKEPEEEPEEESESDFNESNNEIFTVIIEPPYTIDGKWFYPKKYDQFTQVGIINKINNLEIGSKTFNGEIYHPESLTAAHATLPIPSNILVTNLSNGYSVNVRVNHRGGYSNINILDASPEVFKILKLSPDGDLVMIKLLELNESFLLKKAQIFTEEKIVKNAPISEVSIENIDASSEIIDISTSHESNDIADNNNSADSKINLKEKYIHIASFSFLESAKLFKDSLIEKFDAKIIKTILNDRVFFNVVIGPFKNIDSLIEVLKKDIFNQYEDLSIILI